MFEAPRISAAPEASAPVRVAPPAATPPVRSIPAAGRAWVPVAIGAGFLIVLLVVVIIYLAMRG